MGEPQPNPSEEPVVTVDERGAVLRLRGRASMEALEALFETLMKHPEFSADMNTVWDFTEARGVSALRADQLRAIGRRSRELRTGEQRPRVALVVPSDADYGTARMYEGLVGPEARVELHVFRQRADAMAWAFEG